MSEYLPIDKNIPKKVLEVNTENDDLQITSESVIEESKTSKSEVNRSTSVILESFEVINDWEKIHVRQITGTLREVAEYVAKQNLSKKLPTTKEIKVHTGISKEYCKKILAKARSIGLLAIHQKRSGHQFRYYVTNIHDYIILESDLSKPVEVDQEISLEKDLLLPLSILDDLIERENVSFHHINLKSKLTDKSDYERLNWRIGSDSNKGKIFELKLSTYRRCEIIVYPRGTVTMIIKCSNDPLYLTTLDNVANFYSLCGEILGVIKSETSNSEPLIDDVADWKLTQIDAAFDIPLSDSDDYNQYKGSNRQKGLLSYSNFGTFKLKYLGQFYQMYSKNILHKGQVLRIERRFSFLDLQPTVNMIRDNIEKRNN